MIFSISDVSSGGGEVFISTSSTDVNLGVVISDGAGGIRNFGTPVAPQQVIYLHTAGATEADVNITRFYTKK